jgi:hypothetical protein
MCDVSRNDRQGTCPLCSRSFPLQGRGIYCGPTCRQRAFRLRRRQASRPTLTALADMLRGDRRLTAHTVYECPSCQERFLGERRCGDCNSMCRKLGLGGECGGCAEIVTLNELLDLDPVGGDTAA